MIEFFEAVWAQIATPTWVADTGLPVATALVGLWIAVVLVRRQIQSDQTLRRADRLVDQAAPLGHELMEAARRMRIEDTSGEYWTAKSWPDARPLLDAIQANISILGPDMRQHVVETLSQVAGLWSYVAGLSDPVPNAKRAEAMRVTLTGLAADIDRHGKAIAEWDGTGTIPDPPRAAMRATAQGINYWIGEYHSYLAAKPALESSVGEESS